VVGGGRGEAFLVMVTVSTHRRRQMRQLNASSTFATNEISKLLIER